jgi:hypothetical protein
LLLASFSHTLTPMKGVKILSYFLVFAVCVFIGGRPLITHAVNENEASPLWTTPKSMALRKVSDLPSSQTQPNFLSNLDCLLINYRFVASETSNTGCFTSTAFGLFDSDSSAVIYNGTDEALPLKPYSTGEILVPWPKALDVLALDTAPTGGSMVSLYRNPLRLIKDERNYLGQLTAKRLSAPPDMPLYDSGGHRLTVNAQTMAFSDSGSWLVAETLYGNFVRMNLATLDVTAFAPAFSMSGSPAQLKSQVAISNDGGYAAINNDASDTFKVFDLKACPGSGSMSGYCPSHDYLSYIRSQLPSLQYIRHVQFINNGLISFEAYSSTGSDRGTYVLAPTENITSLTDYIALGDSYTSGEGAFDYRAGSDSDTNKCHLSANSYPLLLTRDLFTSNGGHSVACSSAKIYDTGNSDDSYRGQIKNGFSYFELERNQTLLSSIKTNYLPGYIAQHRFVQDYQPRVVTVSVGGDDIGFSDIVSSCVLPHISVHTSNNVCFNTYEDRLELLNLIKRTETRWQTLFRQLAKEAPFASIYAVGYPDIITDTGNCGLNVHLNQSEREFAKELIVNINSAMQQAAIASGIRYVDISQALVGHRLCETSSSNVAVNGLTAGNDIGLHGVNVVGNESYHPNSLGQLLIAQEILMRSHNLTLADSTAAPLSEDVFLNKPKTGRAISVRIPASISDKRVVAKGDELRINVNGPQNGLPANSVFVVKVDKSVTIGSISTGDDGSATGTITVPVTTVEGGHTIDLVGINQNAQSVDITQPLIIGDSGDIDGDGLPDNSDSCPQAINTGIDEDQDGVDDTCDGFIGNLTSSGGNTSASSDGNTSVSSGDAQQPALNSSGNSGVQLAEASQGVELSAPNLEVVGSFVSQSGVLHQVMELRQSQKIISSLWPTGDFQGNKTSPQQKISKPGLLAVNSPATQKSSIPKARLSIIPWVRWGEVVILAWWLLFLVVWLSDRVVRKKHKRPEFRSVYLTN